MMMMVWHTYRYAARGFAYATHGMSNDSPIFVVICMSFSFKIGGTSSRCIPAKKTTSELKRGIQRKTRTEQL